MKDVAAGLWITPVILAVAAVAAVIASAFGEEERERTKCVVECNASWAKLKNAPVYELAYHHCLNACVGQATAFMGLVSVPDSGTAP